MTRLPFPLLLALVLAAGCGPRPSPPAPEPPPPQPEPAPSAPPPAPEPVELPVADVPLTPEVEVLLADTASPDPNRRAAAYRAIADRGPVAAAAVPRLCEELTRFPKPNAYNLPHDAVRTLVRLGPVATPRLVAMLLKHEQPGARQLAAHTLGQMGPAADRAVPALAKALADASHDVRLTAADALSHVGPTTGRVVPALVQAFREEQPLATGQHGIEGSTSVRISVVRALAAAGEPGRKAMAEVVVPAIIDDLRNGRMDRGQPAHLISACGPLAAPCLPHVLEQLRKRPVDLLSDQWMQTIIEVGPAGVAAYKELLGDANTHIRKDALRAFYYLKIDVTVFAPEVAAAMRADDPGVRWAAVDQVYKFPAPPPELVAAAVALLGDKGVAESYPPTTGIGTPDGGPVARALVRIGKPAVPGITKALASDDVITRTHAALALGEIGPAARDALPALRKLEGERFVGPVLGALVARYKIAGDDDALAGLAALADGRLVEVNLGAARELARFGPAAAAHEGVFLPLLEHEDPAVRAAALESVVELGPGAKRAAALIAGRIRRPEDLGRVMPPPLRKLGPSLAPAVPALRSCLRQNQQWGQTNECEVLEAIGPAARDAVPELVAVVEKGDYKAVYALRALAALRPTAADALPAARAGLRNRHFGVRGAALQLLGAVGPEAREALPEVREALGDPDAAVRMWAVYAGIRIEGSAAPYLTQLARELGPDGPGRGRSVFSAGEAFAWEIVPVLAPEAPEVVPVVLDWLRRSPPDLRRPAALRAVANYGPAARGAVSLILADLARPVGQTDNREVLCEALGAIGPAASDALPALRVLGDTSGWKVAWAARRAVERIERKE